MGEDAMGKEICELCGYRSEPRTIEKHHIVPTKVTELAGMPESAIVRLCSNCHKEVHTWYSENVFDMAYDPGIKRFRQRSPVEMVKEYEAAYRVFAAYKKGAARGFLH